MRSFAFVLSASLLACTRAASTQAPSTIAVSVGSEGFSPSSIQAKAGQATTLVFTRTTDATCGTEVVFPDLSLREKLPLNTPVSITLPAGGARTVTFTCGMGMLRGSIVVE